MRGQEEPRIFGSLLTAGGGGGGKVHEWTEMGSGDEPNSSYDRCSGGTAGTPNGNVGAGCVYRNQTASGGAGFSLSFNKQSGSYGKGRKC